MRRPVVAGPCRSARGSPGVPAATALTRAVCSMPRGRLADVSSTQTPGNGTQQVAPDAAPLEDGPADGAVQGPVNGPAEVGRDGRHPDAVTAAAGTPEAPAPQDAALTDPASDPAGEPAGS